MAGRLPDADHFLYLAFSFTTVGLIEMIGVKLPGEITGESLREVMDGLLSSRLGVLVSQPRDSHPG